MRPIKSGEFTTADLELTPDDGMRYELVDGVMVVTPTSSAIHQRALQALSLHMVLYEGEYVGRAVVSGSEVFEAEVPFPVKVVPAELVRR